MKSIRPLPINLIAFLVSIMIIAKLNQQSIFLPSIFIIIFPIYLLYLLYEIVQIKRQVKNSIYEPFIMGISTGIIMFYSYDHVNVVRTFLLTFLDVGRRGGVEGVDSTYYRLLLPFYFKGLLGGFIGFSINRVIELTIIFRED